MHFVLAILATGGLYFFLKMFDGLHSVAFTALGMSITWFAVLFLIGTGIIFKVALK